MGLGRAVGSGLGKWLWLWKPPTKELLWWCMCWLLDWLLDYGWEWLERRLRLSWMLDRKRWRGRGVGLGQN